MQVESNVTTGTEADIRPIGSERKLRQGHPSVPLSSKLHALQVP